MLYIHVSKYTYIAVYLLIFVCMYLYLRIGSPTTPTPRAGRGLLHGKLAHAKSAIL